MVNARLKRDPCGADFPKQFDNLFRLWLGEQDQDPLLTAVSVRGSF
jgi:hypothetical protein